VVRPILTFENPVLREKAKKVARVDASIQRLLDDLTETMLEAPGAGLAANQIGVALRVCVVKGDDKQIWGLVNPEIVKAEGEALGTEGCLSIPGYIGENIRRAEKIVVKGQDVRGKAIKVNAEGWFARVLQHEIDHLDGILFLDRLDRPEDLHEVREEDEEELKETAVVE